MKLHTALLTGLMLVTVSGAAMAQSTTSAAGAAGATTTTTVTATPASAATAPAVKNMPGDVDRDGRVSKSEFMASYEKRFTRMDANNDGYITTEERDAMKKPGVSKVSTVETTADPVAEDKPSFLKRLFN